MITVIDKNRIKEWKDCFNGSGTLSSDTVKQMLGDYLHEIWVIQEINGDLPEEFEGLQ